LSEVEAPRRAVVTDDVFTSGFADLEAIEPPASVSSLGLTPIGEFWLSEPVKALRLRLTVEFGQGLEANKITNYVSDSVFSGMV
jgi:hypothetical protein